MARVARSRTRSRTRQGRRLFWSNNKFDGPPAIIQVVNSQLDSQCGDMVGRPIVDSTFKSYQNNSSMVSNGKCTTVNRSYQHDHVPISSIDTHEGNLTPLKPHSGWMLDLIAGTNPSRSVVTPPELIQNFIELPKLLRETFKYLASPRKVLPPKGLANAHLAVRFGWMPFIEDMMKLLDLQKYVLKRTKELQQLYSARGLRRRLRFADEVKEYTGKWSYPLDGSNNSLEAKMFTFVRKKTWGTIRWKPTAPIPFLPTDENVNKQVTKLVLGLTPEGMAKGLWNVIPWTWLLGWFTNVGKALYAHSNTLPAAWSKACFMTSTTATRIAGPVMPTKSTTQNFVEIQGAVILTRKERYVGSGPVLPGFSMPFLDIGRLSVLGSLAVQRLR